jgi:predicted lysophospholipase L1 biosynthesis ABC-type transport system permease subunit
MSQRVDFDEQRGYHVPYDYQSALYQEQQAPSASPRVGAARQWFDHPHVGELIAQHSRLLVAIVSLGALLAAGITLFTSVSPYDNGYALLAALIALGLVCATIVAINIAFNLKH